MNDPHPQWYECESLLVALAAAGWQPAGIGIEGDDADMYVIESREEALGELLASDEAVLFIRHPEHDRLATLALVWGCEPGDLVRDFGGPESLWRCIYQWSDGFAAAQGRKAG